MGIEVVRRADRRIAPAAPTAVPRDRSEIANRVVNIVLASVALVVLSPIIVLVAIAVKLTSKGPAVYSQTRVGLDRRSTHVDALYDRRKQDCGGMIFTIYKFRTMRADAERNRAPCGPRGTIRASRSSAAFCVARVSTSCRSW